MPKNIKKTKRREKGNSAADERLNKIMHVLAQRRLLKKMKQDINEPKALLLTMFSMLSVYYMAFCFFESDFEFDLPDAMQNQVKDNVHHIVMDEQFSSLSLEEYRSLLSRFEEDTRGLVKHSHQSMLAFVKVIDNFIEPVTALEGVAFYDLLFKPALDEIATFKIVTEKVLATGEKSIKRYAKWCVDLIQGYKATIIRGDNDDFDIVFDSDNKFNDIVQKAILHCYQAFGLLTSQALKVIEDAKISKNQWRYLKP